MGIETSTVELPATAMVHKKKTEAEKKRPKDTAESREEEFGTVVHGGFEDHHSGKLPSGCTVVSMYMEEESRW